MSGMWAKTILRSRNASAPEHVLSTLLVRLPTVLLAEFNTHRAFSRNAASTRAIPTERLIEQVKSDPFIPMHWGANQKGMQAYEETNELVHNGEWSDGYVPDIVPREKAWLTARDHAVESARGFTAAGYHKQIAGRLLAPFMWTIVCVSATEWDNFLSLRDHSDAEPHMQILARAIRAELERDDNIQRLQPGEWHLPFATSVEERQAAVNADRGSLGMNSNDTMLKRLLVLSVARCASTSFKTIDGFDMTMERAEAIYTKLTSGVLHASPFEHVARADALNDVPFGHWAFPDQHRNFRGFRQYRAMIEEAA